MRICKPCWDKLANNIDNRGLGHLVSADNRELISKIFEQIEGTITDPGCYDPLFSAAVAIFANSMTYFGNDILKSDGCPLCMKTEIESRCTDPKCRKESGDDWIRYATDDQHTLAKERGWVIPVA